MEWEVVTLDRYNREGEAMVTISGNGLFSFSVGASDLLTDNERFNYAQFLRREVNGKTEYAVKFLPNKEDNSCSIKRYKQHGRTNRGFAIYSTKLYKEIVKSNSEVKQIRYKVEKIADDILKFNTESGQST